MTRSASALRFRRLANAFQKKADYWAGVDETENPWWLRNVRLYQNRMAEADAARSKILIEYLTERRTRKNDEHEHIRLTASYYR